MGYRMAERVSKAGYAIRLLTCHTDLELPAGRRWRGRFAILLLLMSVSVA